MPKVRQRTEESPSALHSLYLAMLHEFLADPRKLLDLHDEARGDSGRPRRELEVLKRAAVILTVTSWETFIENTLKWTFEDRLNLVTHPRELQGTFKEVAREWMKKGKNLADNPERLSEWSADGWKDVVQAALSYDLDRFHNPTSDNIRRMYRMYLEVDVTAKWRWRGMTSKRACEQLDDLMRLRGKLTHSAKGRGIFSHEAKAAVRPEDAVNAIKLVERLARCTLLALPAYTT